MDRTPLTSLLAPVALLLAVVLALAFVVGGLGGVVLATTMLIIVAGLLSRLDWTRDDAITQNSLLVFEPAPIPVGPSDLAQPISAPEPGRRSTRRIAGWADAMALSRVRAPEQIATLVVTGFVAVLLGAFLLRGLTTNPVALFCDEAEIGLEAWRSLHRQAELTSIPLFYQHFDYEFGALPVLWTAPFVAIFGLDDFAVRLAAVLPILATLVVIYLTLRRLKTPFALVAVALYAFSPVLIHLSRVNFGHGPALLLVVLGFDRFVVARQTSRVRPAIVAGLLLGASAFGNPSMLVVTPLIVGALCLSEIVFNRRRWSAYATIGWTLLGVAFGFAPLIYRALTNEAFWRRIRDKNLTSAPLLSTDRLHQVVDNYPKYFSLDYLFRVGESGMPGAFVNRHSVPGAGELNLALFPVLGLAVVTLVLRWREPETRFFFPWFVVAALYPLPDVLTTTTRNAPYTVALFGTFLCLPYLAGYAMHGIEILAKEAMSARSTVSQKSDDGGNVSPDLASRGRPGAFATLIAGCLLIWVLVTGWQFYTGPYHNYPNVSANYWGWQYGPEPMIDYFLDHQDQFDEFIMEGDFNQAYVFLDFYIRDPDVRAKASIGDISRLDLTKRQLFGMRKETWDNLAGSQVPPKSYMVIDAIIPYPNGQDAMYLLELR